ncbi:PREDICTED: transient receptor potential cation channel subfamily M member 2 [Colobus angolensis palliatus]|uniref:transient receptor potential cation channel subfamily M member 2 n=1 Tax=Colobus angolensis palliatus TaxID=336983 RepID=UPI0005F4A9D3|nr:PREDICTED: transient receptor potential cation channel subfamily M member 2 [Colobus angolensis palliatus]
MEPSALRKAGSEQEEGFVGPRRRVADLGMVSNLRRSNSSLFKGWRPQCPFGNDKQESLSSWIPENIKKKECVYFVESSKLSDAGKVVCQCGYTREQHLEEATKPDTFQGTQWDPKKHVQEMPTDAFGDIVFTGLSQEVKKVGAWIITGGSHAGVMKQVGEAVRDMGTSGSFPAEYILDEDSQGNLTCLDSNHSHFILVDDGTHGQYGVEIPLRTRLEKFISEQTKERGGVAIKIPIVCVVLEGGPGTLQTIYNATTNGTPCVVVEGSGRVADVIAQVANLPVSDITISLIQQKLSVFFQEMFETFTESRIVEWTKKVQGVSLRSLYKRSSGHVTFTMDPVRDLLIWAIVQNRRELAGIIWAQSQDCIAGALACSKILKELSKEEEDTDSSEEMLALAEECEHRAIGVFTECYRKDEERAQKLLIRVSEAWGKTTCLQLALEAKDMKFVSHGGIQAFLTKVWWGQLCVDNGLWRVTLCMLAFPLLLTGLISFREKRLQGVSSPVARARAFFTAPVVVFHLNILSYFAFLCLFAYVLMVDFQPTPSWCECAIYLWLFSLVCEETRQLFYDPDECGLMKKAALYFSDFWNKLDVGAILLFVAGLTCRLIPATLYPGRVILSLDFILFCLRLMHIFTVSKTLGPKIIIVKRMMKDVFFFLFLLAVWVVSFGVAKQAILIHNERRVDWLFRGAVYHSYLTIFGQIPGYIDGVNFNPEHCSPNGTDPYKPKCPESDVTQQRPAFPEWLTVLLLCLYLLFTNILLLNLLIAMFNYTFQQVQEHTDQIWKFQRHDLIEEYHSRPAAPPPFILLSHLQLFIKRVILKTPAKRHKQLKNKLEKNEEAALLSWEIYLKENYLQNQQFQQKQRPEQKIEDISNKVDAMVDLLDLDPLKRSGSMEQRLASLEEQVAQTAQALHWIVKTLRASGFGSEVDVPTLASQKAMEEPDTELGGGKKMEEPGDSYHVNARHLLYPSCPITRFPVPNEKVPWETEFLIYDPPFYTAERKDAAAMDPVGDTLEPLSMIHYNMVDGLRDRRSFHGPYAVQAGLPLNPMGRTGLRGRGSLSCFGPNHTLYPMVTRGSCAQSWWRAHGGPGHRSGVLALPIQVYKGYMDDPRNTDNAWIETVAVSIHFQDQNDVELNRLNSNLHPCDSGACIRWQVVDRRVPLYTNHKTLLQKVAAEFGAHY